MFKLLHTVALKSCKTLTESIAPSKFFDFVNALFLLLHSSLENYSDKIRWAFDLRFQNAEVKSSASFGVKDHILLRTNKDPNHEVNWDAFNKVNRIKATSTAGSSSKVSQAF